MGIVQQVLVILKVKYFQKKTVKQKDLAGMVYRLEITYEEIIDILDVKYNARSTSGYTLPPGRFEISDINLMLKSLLPKTVKVKITIYDIRLKSNSNNNKAIRFNKKLFLY